MGVFSRFKDIVGSNLNAILDRAEDPLKMIRLMIQEMEETLVEMKSSCAEVMAARKKIGREMDVAEAAAKRWEERAALAVDKGRDDLAREALVEKNSMLDRVRALEDEAAGLDDVIEAARADIERLEEKLNSAKDKQRVLAARHERAGNSIRAGRQIRKADSTEAIVRFDKFESRIERLEAEAELAHRTTEKSLEKTFEGLERDEALEKELAELKAKAGKGKAAKSGKSE